MEYTIMLFDKETTGDGVLRETAFMMLMSEAEKGWLKRYAFDTEQSMGEVVRHAIFKTYAKELGAKPAKRKGR